MRSKAITLAHRHKLALLGEDYTAQWLSKRGFQLLLRNYRRPSAELDLVFMKASELLVIEVKTRQGAVEDFQQLIPPRKLAALWRGLDRLLMDFPEWHGLTIHLGLAVVTGLGTEAQHLEWMRLPLREDQ